MLLWRNAGLRRRCSLVQASCSFRKPRPGRGKPLFKSPRSFPSDLPRVSLCSLSRVLWFGFYSSYPYSSYIFNTDLPHETFINTHLTWPFTSFQCVLSLNHFLHSLSLASRTPYSPGWPFESRGFKKAAKEIEVTFAGDPHLSSHQILSVLKVSS